MTVFWNWRFNPFTNIKYPIERTEIHTIQFHTEWAAYGIHLNESPYLESPSTVIITKNPSGPAFTEVSRTVPPSSGQFRVDYDAVSYYGTGRVEFNAADNGTEVLVTYRGTGTAVKNRYLLNQDAIIPTNLAVEGALEITEDLITVGNLSLGKNIGMIDGPQIFNQVDSGFLFECFNVSDSRWSYTNNGNNGKKCLTFTGNASGADAESVYNPVLGKSHIQFTNRETLYLFFNAKGFLAGGSPGAEYNLRIKAYDKNKAFLSNYNIYTFTYTGGSNPITTNFKWYSSSIPELHANTAYIQIAFHATDYDTGDYWYIDYIYGSINGIPISIAQNSTDNGSRLWIPANQRGTAKILWLDESYLLAEDTSDITTITNYDLPYTDSHKYRINGVILRLLTVTGNQATPNKFTIYKGNSGSVKIFGTELNYVLPDLSPSGGSEAVVGKLGVESIIIVPVSYYTASGKAGIRCNNFQRLTVLGYTR